MLTLRMFLLAAYSVKDISSSDLPMISITASKDSVLNKEKFDENKVNLPEGITIISVEQLSNGSTSGSTIYYEIEGGNHAQFGSYGSQKGDGTASIDSDSQQLLVIEILRKFLLSNNL